MVVVCVFECQYDYVVEIGQVGKVGCEDFWCEWIVDECGLGWCGDGVWFWNVFDGDMYDLFFCGECDVVCLVWYLVVCGVWDIFCILCEMIYVFCFCVFVLWL